MSSIESKSNGPNWVQIYPNAIDLKVTDKSNASENTLHKTEHQYESLSSSTSSQVEKCTEPESSEKGHSDATKVKYCEPCHSGHTLIQAHGFCINCTEYLCKSCYNSHKNYKAFKNHELQGYDEMPTDAELITIEDQCLKHEGKPLEYFCRSCDELACTVCMFKQHRSCENVDYIPDIAGNLEESDEYKQLAEDIQCLENKITAGGKTLDASLKTSEESRNQALAKIKTERDDAKKVLDELAFKMIIKVHQRFKMEQNKLAGLKEKNKELSEQLKTAHNRMKYSKNAKQINKLFISVKKDRKAVDDVEKNLHKLQNDYIQGYTFKASKSVENFKILSELGDLHEESLTYDKGSDSIDFPSSSKQGEHSIHEVYMNKESVDYDILWNEEKPPEENMSHFDCCEIKKSVDSDVQWIEKKPSEENISHYDSHEIKQSIDHDAGKSKKVQQGTYYYNGLLRSTTKKQKRKKQRWASHEPFL